MPDYIGRNEPCDAYAALSNSLEYHCIYPMETELETELPPFESEIAALNRKVCYLRRGIPFLFVSMQGAFICVGYSLEGVSLVPRLSCIGLCAAIHLQICSTPPRRFENVCKICMCVSMLVCLFVCLDRPLTINIK